MLSFLTKPRCYFWREGDVVVAQNWVGTMQGQEHRHTPEDWERWRANAERDGWEVTEVKRAVVVP